jgi:hypothetical protein
MGTCHWLKRVYRVKVGLALILPASKDHSILCSMSEPLIRFAAVVELSPALEMEMRD